MKKVILLAFIIASCNPPLPKGDKYSIDSTNIADTTATYNPVSTSKVDMPKEENWSYREEVDQMDSKKSFFADCISTNTLYFRAPYDGGSTFKLQVQKYLGKTEVALYVSPGQFLSSIDNEKSIRIKFDSEKPFYINCGEPSDGSSNVIFLYPAKKIITKLKNAKTVTIEPEFFEEGYQQVNFNIAGLIWKN